MAFRRPSQMRGAGAGVNFANPSISDRIALKATLSYHAVKIADAQKAIKEENKNKAKK